jgi:hypothetical protein
MNEIVNFMYTNRCLISIKNAPDLLVAAKRFDLEKLRKQIAEFLLFRLNVDNAIEILISAHEAGSEALKLACIRLINRHAEKIKRTEKWRTFKTQYTDLVPELYENRVEHPTHTSQAYLPDVFSATTVPSKSLLTLSQLYDNPVQQRLVTPTTRILPAPTAKSQQPSTLHNQPTTEGTSGPFFQHEDPAALLATDQKNPGNKRILSNTRRRAGPPPTVPPLTRTVFPTIKQPLEVDAYRRPVNIYEKSTTLPANHHQQQRQRTGNTQVPHKAPPPPPPPVAKVTRTVSPKHAIEMRRSPTLTETPSPEEHLTLIRVMSGETID